MTGAGGAGVEELTGEREDSRLETIEDEQQGGLEDVHVAKKSKIFWLEQMLAQEVDRRRRLHARFSVQEEAGRV